MKIFRILKIVGHCQHPLLGKECGVTPAVNLEPPLTRWHDWKVNKYAGSHPQGQSLLRYQPLQRKVSRQCCQIQREQGAQNGTKKSPNRAQCQIHRAQKRAQENISWIYIGKTTTTTTTTTTKTTTTTTQQQQLRSLFFHSFGWGIYLFESKCLKEHIFICLNRQTKRFRQMHKIPFALKFSYKLKVLKYSLQVITFLTGLAEIKQQNLTQFIFLQDIFMDRYNDKEFLYVRYKLLAS